MFDKEQTIAELTFLQPENPSSLVLFSQDFEEKPFDYPHQGLLFGTRRPMDVDLYPIFDEEYDPLDELGPTFDEKALSITPIIMENRLCFDPGTTPTPLSKEHYKELCIINSVPDLFDKVSSIDIKRSGLDHLEKSFELDVQQLVFCSRKAFDSFNSHKAETDFCGDSVLKPVHSYYESDLELKLLCSESDQVRHVLEMFYGSSCLENILIYSTFFDKHAEPWIRNSQFELNLLCSKSEKLVHVLNLFFRNWAITCPDTILLYNTYFDKLHDDLKRVLHVLGKETLVSDLNKYLSCTYDPGILMFVLSVQDKHDQSPRGVRNRSRDRSYQFEIWRCMYSRKPTSKLRRNLRSNPFKEGGNDVPRSKHRPAWIMDTAQVHSVHTNHVFPLDRADQTVHTIPSDHPDCTARAVHRIDPQMSVLELSLEPRPRNVIDRPISLLSQPIQHSKTDSHDRFNLGREESKDVNRFSLMALFVRTACTEAVQDLSHDSTHLGQADHLKVQSVSVERPAGVWLIPRVSLSFPP
uniref:Uncharacterized protein n=1 Tax=Brassica oleracea var. oleracea TaxID=109376 RepID=A0A0D3BKF2_BRAOL